MKIAAIAALMLLITTLALACGNDAPASSSARSAERTASDAPAAQTPDPEPADTPDPDATSEPASTSSSLFALISTPTAPDSPTATSTPQPTATSAPATATPEPADTPESATTAAPSATPEPADTPEPPPATATPAPTNTPAATPTATPLAPTATPEPTPTFTPLPTATPPAPTATPQPLLYGNMTADDAARALGALDIDGYRSEGHIFDVVEEYDDIDWQEMNLICGPDIGSAVAPYAESNPTFIDHSNFIWVWAINDDDEYGRCIKLSKYVEWLDIPAPSRDPVRFGLVYDQRATENTEKVVYSHQVDDRSYTMPPLRREDRESGAIWQGDTVEAPSAGYSGECQFENNPLAVWTHQKGLVKISDDDLRQLLGFGDAWFDIHGENRGEARQAGVFWIITPDEDGFDYWRVRYLTNNYYGYCWVIPNPDEAPEEPCYICEDNGN